MTYDDREKSVHGGQPVECYRIAQGPNLWTWTSGDREVTIPGGTFTPEVISRGQQDFSTEDTGGNLDIMVPRTSDVAALFIPYVPHSPVYVTVFRCHRGDEADALAIFVGRVVEARFEDSEAVLTCAPISQVLTRRFPYLTYQTQCNWKLYSAECGANPTSFKDDVTVTTVDGAVVTSNDFLTHPDGWFNGGWLQRDNGHRRFIVAHVGNQVTLMSPFVNPTLPSLEVVEAYAGCQRTEATCLAKFANLDRHLGFARIPWRNPHDVGVV